MISGSSGIGLNVRCRGKAENIYSRRVFPFLPSRPGEFHPEPLTDSGREPLDSHGSRCSAVGTRGQQLCLVHGLLLLPDGFSWPVTSAEQRSPFAPAPLQNLRRYYGALRPCDRRRYSRPRGGSRLWLLPSRHWRDRAQVLTFHTKAWSSFAPPTCRMPLGPYQDIARADPGGRVSPRF
jgi:hypothetical protein